MDLPQWARSELWRRRALFAVALAVGTAACGKAASLIFDVPPRGSGPTAAGPVVAVAVPADDTTRPLIETVRDPDSVIALLPRHASGAIDWDAALERGVIAPRPAMPGTTRRYLEAFSYDVLLPGPDPSFDVVFRHSRHTPLLTCETCHPRLVRPPSRRDTSATGHPETRSCATCHTTVAFPSTACGRCHASLPTDSVSATLGPDLVLARAGDAQAAAQTLPRSRFPHWTHRIRYRCSACHPTPFEMRLGADTLSMAAMEGGRACAACHDGASAFGLLDCSRCHTEPQRAEPPEW